MQPSTAAVEKSTPLSEPQYGMEFATTTPVDEIEFIPRQNVIIFVLQLKLLKGNYGHCLGKIMDRPLSRGIFGNSIFSHVIAKTASACDARIGWCF